MCGFVGGVHGSVDPETLARLLARLRHRGPDGKGLVVEEGFALGACRLAVQGDDRARPPVASRDGRFLVAFNGEILGPRLGALRRLIDAGGGQAPEPAAGDLPLLVEAIAAVARSGPLQGPHLLEMLEGSMGALVVRDRAVDEAWLVRDRLGIKPLHVLATEDGVWFASELEPLLAHFPEHRRPDEAGLAELLHFQRPVRRLPFHGIESLGPGAAWRIRPGGRITRWIGGQGVRDLEERSSLEPQEALRALADAFEASAGAAAAAAGGVSIFLSGGLDSGAAALLARRADLLALTGRFAPPGGALDESAAAAEVAGAAGLAHGVVDLSDEHLIEDLPAVVRALEIPLAGPGALPMWRMARRAREHGRVVLTGTGGDELLGGYARTALVLGRRGAWTEGYEGLAARIDAAGDDLAARQRVVLDRSADLRPLLAQDFAETLPTPEPAGRVARYGAAAGDAVSALVHDEIEGTLPMLLHVEDRITMAHGLEGRPVPCLGEVPRAAARLPVAWLVGADGEGKRALRHVLEGRMPESVRTDRRKRGFPTPFARAARGASRQRVREVLEDQRFRERGWWNVPACRAALARERPLHDRAVYALLSWEFWARAFLDGDAFRTEPAA